MEQAYTITNYNRSVAAAALLHQLVAGQIIHWQIETG
jgi:hypothetical protein